MLHNGSLGRNRLLFRIAGRIGRARATDDTAIRRALDQWLGKHEIHPVMIGEFEDYGLLREFARAGHGVAPVPSIMEESFRREYGFAKVGVAVGIKSEFYAVSIERKIKNPAIAAMIEHAREVFVGTQ
jgi:LysR family transcriptional activator of nhaA